MSSTNASGVPLTGEIDRTSIDSDGFGGSAQVVNKSGLFGLGNQFLLGASIDHGVTSYRTQAEFGTVDPGNLIVTGSGIFASAPFDLAPRNVRGTNDYYGVFLSDALDLTDAFTLTLGGRFNLARIQVQDLTGAPEAAALNGTHTYSRFNPQIGATYKLSPTLSAYGGYSEANRAPTIAELSCSDPANPCVISSFLTSDPELKQVVSHTYEAGLRGQWASFDARQSITWSAGLFSTLNTDDIISVNSAAQGRGFFQNAGETLRQGVELGINYRNPRLSAYGAYNYVDATYQTPLSVSSTNNPQNPSPGNPFSIQIQPGNHIPGIAAHKFKVGIDYLMTPEWKLGADMVTATDQFFQGDGNNQNKPLSGYAVFNLHTSYDVSKSIQVYGLVNNVFDARYGTYGSYVNLVNANSIGNAITFTDGRSITPAAPFAAYGGVKFKF